jgi:hypothetical protein
MHFGNLNNVSDQQAPHLLSLRRNFWITFVVLLGVATRLISAFTLML